MRALIDGYDVRVLRQERLTDFVKGGSRYEHGDRATLRRDVQERSFIIVSEDVWVGTDVDDLRLLERNEV